MLENCKQIFRFNQVYLLQRVPLQQSSIISRSQIQMQDFNVQGYNGRGSCLRRFINRPIKQTNHYQWQARNSGIFKKNIVNAANVSPKVRAKTLAKDQLESIFQQKKQSKSSEKFGNKKISICQRVFFKREITADAKDFAIKLILAEKKQYTIRKVQREITGLKLKEYIFSNISKYLKPKQMVLEYNNSVIANNQILSKLTKVNSITITQRKREVWQIPKLKSDKNKVDEICGLQGVAYLSTCSHYFSRGAMLETVKYQIDGRRMNNVRCPYSKQGESQQICNSRILRKQIQLIGGYTVKEMNELYEKMSRNWISNNCEECPFSQCEQSIGNIPEKEIKIECPSCHKVFCKKCRRSWMGTTNLYCGYDKCFNVYEIVENSQKTRKFQFPGLIVMAPQFRVCPRKGCNQIVENIVNCKHTPCKCQNDKYSFCFVCLSIGPPWSCGGSYDYCGKLAPNQTVKEILGL